MPIALRAVSEVNSANDTSILLNKQCCSIYSGFKVFLEGVVMLLPKKFDEHSHTISSHLISKITTLFFSRE
jgi:hypothetical protein